MGRKLIAHPLYAIVYVLFVFFVAIPIVYTIATTFTGGSFLKNLHLLNVKAFYLLLKSIGLSALIAFLSTVLGVLLGFLLYKTTTKFSSFFKIVLLVPLIISPYILAVAWKDFFFIAFDKTSFITSYIGVLFVLTTIFTPLAMLIIGSALTTINAQLEDAGRMITNTKSTFFNITLPLIKPALISSFTLIFIFSISEFSVPAFFGVDVFTTEIFTQFSAFYNHTLAILQATLLILICVLLLLSEKKYLADAPFFTIGNKGASHTFYNLKNSNCLSQLFLFGWLFISVIFPFLTLLTQSFKGGWANFTKAFTLLLPTFGNSIAMAFTGALLIVFIGFTVAYYTHRHTKSPLAKSFNWLMLIVFAIPSTVFGISLIKFYNQPAFTFIYASYAIILIGYVGKYSFISTKLIGNAIKQIPNSLEEAAQMEGISFSVRLRKIILPLLLPALFVSFVVSFIFSLGELGTTIMVYPPGTEIMPIKVFTIMANAPQAITSSMTLLVFSVTLLLITGFYFIVKPLAKKYHFTND